MSLLASKSPWYAAGKSIGLLFFFMLTGLFFDSYFFEKISDHGQLYANAVMFIVTGIIFYQVTKRNKEQMISAILIAIVGEYLFSIALGMYTYKFENVPHYIPPGHAVVYVAVLYFSKASSIIKHKTNLEKLFTYFIFCYALVFLILKNDVFGFVMTIATLFILRNKPRERLFYLTMYLAVAFLEIVGTTYQCWKWPPIAWNTFEFLPSYNPPSGISFFYFGLDLGSLWLYKQRHKIAWNRMKNIRKIRAQQLNFTTN
ncbi:MAG: hypothetical protein HWD82_10565 [Flavobacteriaceae bacterium]|nr:hypothetical protein [Flavobacteriaceae bacterium]